MTRVNAIVDTDQNIQSLVLRIEEMVENERVVTSEFGHEQNCPRRTHTESSTSGLASDRHAWLPFLHERESKRR